MGKIIFITGATRSGKSQLAVNMAKGISGKDVAFVATCIPEDEEMRRRITLHKKNRPCHWKTIEVKDDMPGGLKKLKGNFKAVIIDCLTLFVSNLVMKGSSEKEIRRKVEDTLKFISKAPYSGIIVSNEVGGGIVPANRLAREFRDLAGIANQIVAKRADEAYYVVSGIPMKIK